MGMFSSSFLLLLFFFSIILSIDSAAPSCPIDLSYVETFPWDTSSCLDPNGKHCCQTLLSLIGMGLAQQLKETSMFQFPDEASSSSCLSDLQTKLVALSIQPSVVPRCFESTQFVANRSSCAGIITTPDWNQKISSMTSLEEFCEGDLTGLIRCSSCYEAGLRVDSQLTSLDPNATKCFYFTVLYVAGIVNKYGPKNASTASCVLGLPLSTSATDKSSNHLSRNMVIGLSGALVGVLLAVGVIILYRKRRKKEMQQALHEEYVSSFRASVLPNTGARWFQVSELERATNRFCQRNMIGQGAHGVVYKGSLADGTLVAVKELLDLDSKGDEDFCNEVEIISKIRHRNLLECPHHLRASPSTITLLNPNSRQK